MPLCNRMFCCIFGWYLYIEIRLKYEKIFCCPALELFHFLPLWTTVRLHGKKLQNSTKTFTTQCMFFIHKYERHIRWLYIFLIAAWDIALFSPTSASFPKSTLAIIGNVHAIRTQTLTDLASFLHPKKGLCIFRVSTSCMICASTPNFMLCKLWTTALKGLHPDSVWHLHLLAYTKDLFRNGWNA